MAVNYNMSTLEILKSKAERLPDALQREAVDFVDYLLQKFESKTDENKQWSAFSMQNAVRGFEDDPVTYSKDDVLVL
ncbi:MAG: DUF2281 domain-containing protein [Bacteroidota bacterium]|nr:DUF2281 domain-containing protein [Bacteroidota bacterium]MDP4231000.1 DUF2281 domain-containing protein [Bacteroidota bacterium]